MNAAPVRSARCAAAGISRGPFRWGLGGAVEPEAIADPHPRFVLQSEDIVNGDGGGTSVSNVSRMANIHTKIWTSTRGQPQ